MHDVLSNFSDMVFANLGTEAQAWYRDVKISLGAGPLTWSVFKERIRARFRDKSFKFKTLTKMYELKAKRSKQEYTSRFLHLLSQVDTELPEVAKRCFFQQNLRADTSAYISPNVPETLEQGIKMAQRLRTQSPLVRGLLQRIRQTRTPKPTTATKATTSRRRTPPRTTR
ncbi:hypothetical protein PHMEG_00021736 [Phytophthora megakarya]|uniref:Ty3 transposon capsid-like protein domain-containing protein n=1 Tax=Phytophthora megakarya TaxID=4795 RepID=A0A225VKI8_9STRA|nr:hypothetical protein PHMEG_00021736 [Phytophthora megakarya]